jgi:hypothetical protein
MFCMSEGGGKGPDGVRRRLSPTLFGIVLLCFLLPFVTVECGEPVTFTGVHAATGIDRPEAYADQPAPNVWALIAFTSAWTGLLVGLLRGRTGAIGGALAAFAGIVGLVGFIVYVAGMTHGRFTARIGYMLSLLLFVGAVALNDRLLSRRTRAPNDESGFGRATRVYLTAMGVIAATMLIAVVGSAVDPSGGGGSGYFEMSWYSWVFSAGVLVAACTGLGALMHALSRVGGSDLA